MTNQLSADSEADKRDQYWQDLIVGSDTGAVDEVGHPDMGRHFNRIAYGFRRRAVVRSLKRAGFTSPRSVFEAAYGVGYYLNVWQSLGVERVTGVELSDRAAKHAGAAFPNFDLRSGDVTRLNEWADWPSLRATFDVATAIDILYHIVDDALARNALQHLGEVVRDHGVVLVTEKFPAAEAVREGWHVRRRPISWYAEALPGFELVFTAPVFFCLDPPVFTTGQTLKARLSYLCWGAIRAAVKFWPRNSFVQAAAGTVAASAGAVIDSIALAMVRRVPNLTVAVFQKKAGGSI